MRRYHITDNRISDHSIRNFKEQYALSDAHVINIYGQHGPYDPELQETISARLAIGKTEKVLRGKEKVGMILHMRFEDIPILIQALNDSGFLPLKRAFSEEIKGLEGFAGERRMVGGRMIRSLVKDSPLDKAFQSFFQRRDHEFWDLCLIYRDYILRHAGDTYSFFISY